MDYICMPIRYLGMVGVENNITTNCLHIFVSEKLRVGIQTEKCAIQTEKCAGSS